MTTISCPVCRADNDAGPTCRRCKADLVLLFELAARRAAALRLAAQAAARGEADAVLHWAAQAHLARRGPDTLRWLAIGHLVRRDFAAALACYRSVTEGQDSVGSDSP